MDRSDSFSFRPVRFAFLKQILSVFDCTIFFGYLFKKTPSFVLKLYIIAY